jgi:hypothetical protein
VDILNFVRIIVLAFLVPLLLSAEDWFAGGFVGISTLSADATSQVTGATAAISQYKPENGWTAMGFFGRHINDYLSFQGTYGWNQNDVALFSATTEGLLGQMSYEATMSTAVAEAMVYFRNRRSTIRPYLAAGFGATHLSAESGSAGTPGIILPATRVIAFPREFSATKPAFRAAVGIDIRLRGGLAFRYCFSETIQGNAISEQLRPPGERNLANFQNLFGFAWHF